MCFVVMNYLKLLNISNFNHQYLSFLHLYYSIILKIFQVQRLKNCASIINCRRMSQKIVGVVVKIVVKVVLLALSCAPHPNPSPHRGGSSSLRSSQYSPFGLVNSFRKKSNLSRTRRLPKAKEGDRSLPMEYLIGTIILPLGFRPIGSCSYGYCAAIPIAFCELSQ